MFVVVAYDVSSHRRRARLHELLLAHGTPVQKSVFECDLTPAQLRRLRVRAAAFARGPRDAIRYYHLCARCRRRTRAGGTDLAENGSAAPYVA